MIIAINQHRELHRHKMSKKQVPLWLSLAFGSRQLCQGLLPLYKIKISLSTDL